LLALVGYAHSVGFRQPGRPGIDLALWVVQGGNLALYLLLDLLSHRFRVAKQL
jgi:hypothetical protein